MGLNTWHYKSNEKYLVSKSEAVAKSTDTKPQKDTLRVRILCACCMEIGTHIGVDAPTVEVCIPTEQRNDVEIDTWKVRDLLQARLYKQVRPLLYRAHYDSTVVIVAEHTYYTFISFELTAAV